MDHQDRIRKTEELIAGDCELRAAFHSDLDRPTYHFMPPSAWMNDINGCLFWKGRYHIFYQHNPEGAYWKWMQWGHASSIDLVHWVHHPIALTPDLDGPDRKGCFSGGAFTDRHGTPTFVYYGVPDGMCLATSRDDLLIHWAKHPSNPVIPEPAPGDAGFGEYTVHDPCAWLCDDTYYAAVNRRDPGGDGDGAFLFTSEDLAHWEYRGPFYDSRRCWTESDEDCAVPDFFPLGDKHMLLFCSHLQGTQYYLGRWQGGRFEPETHGRMGWPGGLLGGARTLRDGQGRRVFFDWVREVRGVDRERASGWSGVMTSPRILSLAADGTLLIEPAPELNVLRMNHRHRREEALVPDSELTLAEMAGDCLELAVELDVLSAQQVGVVVRRTPDGAEQTVVAYDAASRVLRVDTGRSTADETIRYWHYRNAGALERLAPDARAVAAQEAPFALAPGESLQLRIFLDRSLLEVFANGRQCVTQRIHPTRADSLGVSLFALGGDANVRSVEAWDMAPAHL